MSRGGSKPCPFLQVLARIRASLSHPPVPMPNSLVSIPLNRSFFAGLCNGAIGAWFRSWIRVRSPRPHLHTCRDRVLIHGELLGRSDGWPFRGSVWPRDATDSIGGRWPKDRCGWQLWRPEIAGLLLEAKGLHLQQDRPQLRAQEGPRHTRGGLGHVGFA